MSSSNIEEIKDICKIICDKVKRHGGKECLVSVSPPKSAGDLMKTGVHLNWPGFVVDQVISCGTERTYFDGSNKSKRIYRLE